MSRDERYTPAEIEPKWQAFWEKDRTFATDEDPNKPKAYVLDMFPYPSGSGLHVGHPEGYTATDIVARYLRAKGTAVLHPMGWDAFGLPAEQHAIKTGTHPAETTQKNIATFKRQLKSLGLSYDWDREIDTTDPEYVKWTQWIFLELFDRGLAYQAELPVNWCPALGTVLANEEVKDGRSERGGHPVFRVPLRQWMLKITAYADRLLEDLSQVTWPEGTRVMQTEWIGRSEGAEVDFAVDGHPGKKVEIFTTRPDTLFGATFMVLAPEHPLVAQITTREHTVQVQQYVERAKRRSERDRRENKEKTGVATGAYAINPVNGKTIPIWIADYVLWGYGTGAIMAVPGHDERDFEFAKRLGLPIARVVREPDGDPNAPLENALVGEGIACHSGQYDGLSTNEFKTRITADLEQRGQGKKRVEYKLRDWIFSRQRYWGEPFPIYFPVECEGDPRTLPNEKVKIDFSRPIAVSREELPVRLPDLEDFKPGDDPAGPLARAKDWRFFQKDGKWYARETNTMPQWAGSCWYYLRFIDPKNRERIFDAEKVTRWLPVDLYVGGAEHAVLHLLYARFWHKVLFDAGLVPVEEPFTKLVHQGMILGEIEYTTYVAADGMYVSRENVKEQEDPVGGTEHLDKRNGSGVQPVRVKDEQVEKVGGRFVLIEHPTIAVDARAHKMSKSRGNVINPDHIVQQFGADSLRLYEMFMGPLEATKPWSTSSITGVKRFLDRVWTVSTRTLSESAPSEALDRMLHKTIRKVGEDIEGLRFNTAISTLMELTNELFAIEQPPKRAIEVLVQLLHPLAPHIAEELWQGLGHGQSVQRAAWPQFDPAKCVDEEIEVPVQVNGKVRGRVKVAADASAGSVVAAAKADEAVAKWLEGKQIVKEQYVPGRILTIVVK
ncbi:leucine--tRNA ligase [Sandaracinus amylolyticus]|uniref:leucine--tRNA ligase n=1 Tax=Sandaracinus amylolyticus TaxID=927083 RepID=UPI001EFF68CF|nr:leucine--tRNA ligase [Sandaracinus amylolyticus]UJR80828.1 Leucine--tRNA ligase, chloroplastic/mitochondrial [Sandaracinus amylolyticus]